VRGRTPGDRLIGLDLRGTCGENGIGQPDLLDCRGKSSNHLFRDERVHVVLVPDASPEVDS